MAKFVRLKLNTHNNQNTQWRLVIDNVDDLYKWCKIDNEVTFTDWLTINPLTHCDGKGASLQRLIDVRRDCLAVGEKISPIEIAAEFLDKRALGMLKLLNSGWELCINQGGGYCDLKGFIEQWNCEILETIEKIDFGFPIDSEVINSEVLVLENDPRNIAYTIKSYLTENSIKKYASILSLKGTDQAYVFKAISNAKTILFHSEFNDASQVEIFCKAFMVLDKKNIIISTYNETDRNILIENSGGLYNSLIEKHNVLFIS